MEKSKSVFKEIFVGVAVAVVSAVIIWKLGVNQSPENSKGDPSAVSTSGLQGTKQGNQTSVINTSSFDSSSTKTVIEQPQKEVNNVVPEISPSWKLVGLWETTVVESGSEVQIAWNVRSNGTSSYTFTTANGYGTEKGTWKFSNGIIYEEFESGGAGKGRVSWRNENEFELTIIDNGVPSNSGVKRIYKRR